VKRVAKCEHCGQETDEGWPGGWVRTGTSSYGTRYDEYGVAWHCPSCVERGKLELWLLDNQPIGTKPPVMEGET